MNYDINAPVIAIKLNIIGNFFRTTKKQNSKIMSIVNWALPCTLMKTRAHSYALMHTYVHSLGLYVPIVFKIIYLLCFVAML